MGAGELHLTIWEEIGLKDTLDSIERISVPHPLRLRDACGAAPEGLEDSRRREHRDFLKGTIEEIISSPRGGCT